VQNKSGNHAATCQQKLAAYFPLISGIVMSEHSYAELSGTTNVLRTQKLGLAAKVQTL
jgi:hypothetical protein